MPLRDLGAFTFKIPTVGDSLAILTQRQALLAKVGNTAFVTIDLMLLADISATIPRQVAKAPDGWKWDEVYDPMELYEVYESYSLGVQEFREGKKTKAPTTP